MNEPNKNNKNGSPRVIDQGELTHVSTKKFPYKIVHGWDLQASRECNNVWQKAWIELFDLIQQQSTDEAKQKIILDSISTEDLHWNWFEKASAYNSNEYEWFHLYADSKPQATCVIYHPEESALAPGNIFYVKFVAVAPQNRPCNLRPREFVGLGTVILRAAQRFAVMELNLRPGFCLHSLPKAEGFYTKLKMIKVDGKEDTQSLAYFELPQDDATELIRAC